MLKNLNYHRQALLLILLFGGFMVISVGETSNLSISQAADIGLEYQMHYYLNETFLQLDFGNHLGFAVIDYEVTNDSKFVLLEQFNDSILTNPGGAFPIYENVFIYSIVKMDLNYNPMDVIPFNESTILYSSTSFGTPGMGFKAYDGKLFVASNHTIQVYNYDLELQYQFGGYGTLSGQLKEPVAFAINEDYLYVADNRNNRVQVFLHNGTYVAKTTGVITDPTAITTDGDDVYVTTSNTAPIVKLNKLAIKQLDWGQAVFNFPASPFDTSPGKFNFYPPVAITSLEPYVFVPDSGIDFIGGQVLQSRIQIFDGSGNYINDFHVNPDTPVYTDFIVDLEVNNTHLSVLNAGTESISFLKITGNIGNSGESSNTFMNETLPLISRNQEIVLTEIEFDKDSPDIPFGSELPGFGWTYSIVIMIFIVSVKTTRIPRIKK